MNFLKKILRYNLIEGMVLVVGFFYSIYISHHFKVEEIGKFAIVLSVFVIVAQVNSLGTPTWLLLRIKKSTISNALLTSYLHVNILAALIFPTLLYCFFLMLGIEHELMGLYILFLFYSISVSTKAYLRPFYLRKLNTKAIGWISIVGIGGQALMLITLLTYFQSFSYYTLVVAFTFAAFFRAAASVYLLDFDDKVRIKHVLFKLPSIKLSKIMISQSLKINLNDTLILLFTQLPYQTAAFFGFSNADIGIYNRANQLALLFNTAIQSVFPLILSHWINVNKKTKLRALIIFLVFSAIIFSSVLIVFYDSFGVFLSVIYGDFYLLGGDIFKLCFIMCMFFMNYKLINNYLLSEGRILFSIINSGLMIIVPVIICFILGVTQIKFFLVSIIFIYILVFVLFYLVEGYVGKNKERSF